MALTQTPIPDWQIWKADEGTINSPLMASGVGTSIGKIEQLRPK